MQPTAPMTGTPFGSGSLAFLFTDIEGSTQRWERAPRAMEEAVARHDRILRAIFVDRGGHVFKTMGDAFCVAFDGPSVALGAAIAAQHALAEADFSAVDGIRVRMAIHVGEIQARDNDYFGQPVNRVARLLSIAHGEQLILSGAASLLVRDHLPEGVSLIDLGEHRLKDLAQPETVLQVAGCGLRERFPALRSLSLLLHNLPQQATSFVGREAELDEVKTLIGRHRLVTLLGPGGLGKTRLSLQVGADLLTRYPDGVWFVELAPLTTRELVGETLAALFGLTLQPGADSAVVVVNFLKSKCLLLIFDNCEHLLAEAARLAAQVLKAAPLVTILASSRERLGVAGEYVYRMPTLGLPARTAGLTAAQAMDHAAIRLFVERATLALGRFELTDETAGDVAEICRRLDGIALAIELAVPRLKMLKPAELLVRLKDRFRLLTGGDRGALPRQQTLRALIDWSWDLLSENERLTLQRLSVFADAITLDDATRVIADDPLEDWEVFDLIASLLEKSLVTPLAETAGASRYRLLETTRAYGLEKLKEGGEEPAFRRRLAQFLIERFRAADAAYPTTASEPWLAEYGPELENLRAGLDWCFGPGGDRALGVELVGLTLTFWEELSLLPERKRWLDLAASALDPVTPPGVAGRILLGRSAAIWLGDRQHLDDLMRAIDLLRAAGDPLWLGRALSAAGRAFARPGDVEQAEPYFRDAEKLLRPLGRTRSLSNLLNARAITCEFAGDPDAARKLYEENLAMERALGNPKVVALVSSNLAELEFSGGHLREAIQRARDAETVCRAGGNLVFLSLILTNLTGYLLADDAVAEARTAGLEALRLNVSLNQDYYIVICLEHLALVHALSNDLERAARLAGHGEAFYGEADRTREATEAATWTKLTGLLDAALPIDRLATLKAEGAGWDRARAAEVALD